MDCEFAVGGRKIEALRLDSAPGKAPTLVLLHEGLGCVAMWRDFPARLAEHTGLGVLTYSRFGYGKSDPVPLPRPLTYMQDEAFNVLPAVLDQAGIGKCILVGHSDGASIATIYAGGRNDARVHGLVLMAPHFFCEEISICAIAEAKDAYENTDFRARLAQYHGDNVDVAFWGWNQAWLDPDFRQWRIDQYLPEIRVPVLLIQGKDDQYGTVAQIETARAKISSPLDVRHLDRCRHSPHIDQQEATLDAVAEFSRRVLAGG
jgi:pimeloyl-ACP methyl ester carboxylesterase